MFVQICLFVLSASAVWFVGRRESWRRWGYIFGLAGQPFWLWATWQHEQYGIFALSLWYAYSWGQGVYYYWLKRES